MTVVVLVVVVLVVKAVAVVVVVVVIVVVVVVVRLFLVCVFVSYHCNFVHHRYIQLYTYRNMSPRYSHNPH